MNEFDQHKDKILKMESIKRKICEISKLNGSKRSSRSRSNLFRIHQRKSQNE